MFEATGATISSRLLNVISSRRPARDARAAEIADDLTNFVAARGTES